MCCRLAKRSGKFRRGHAPYLARIRLFWCDTCNVPLVEENPCSICGATPRRVQITPPGDPYPAMEGHIRSIRTTLDRQYGEGVGEKVVPSNKTVVMNKAGALDAMYEIIVDGHIIGRLRFDIAKMDYTFLLTAEGGRRVSQHSRQKWISVHQDAIPYLRGGANLMLPGVAGCDSEIDEGDEVWLIDYAGMVIGVGIARMSGTAMAEAEKGYAIKIREFAEPEAPHINPVTPSWDDAVKSNSDNLQRIEDEAISFIRRVVRERDLPVSVGFSGGKDSLTTYLLVEKGLECSPPIFFLDTGLELPETVEYIDRFAAERDTDLISTDAGNQFWESVQVFGPPARDFRWCCKVRKLGPAATVVAEELGSETLAFMGQRKLESFARSVEPRVSSNPWVPGQISANPIQDWNALEVWLYIFREEAEFNPLYNKGYQRMGCYLCPSSPLAEMQQLRESHPELHDRWMNTLLQWAEEYGFPSEWARLGFWRWKRLPSGQMNLIEDLGLEISESRPAPSDRLSLNIVRGVSPCASSGYSIEGQFSSGLNLDRLSKLLPVFGKVVHWEDLGALRIKRGEKSINVFSSGSLVIRGNDEQEIVALGKQVERAIKRAVLCQGCGSCILQCQHDALHLVDGRVAVDEEKCSHCLECDNWPCPTYLA
ncbi:phosphoadenosine phosphosulfate reductase [Candidatus Thorarchaeota archaeon]|nr:MAG: phosphoadenosine phosphosulfate reductase [Candidatus Thorarchaeota archaeon]